LKWLALSLILCAAGYGLYAWKYPTYSYQFRITVEVDTVDGVKTGASVLQVRTNQFPYWVTLGNNNSNTWVRGEAVFVDLGRGRSLIALLALGENAEDGAVRSFAPRSFFVRQDIELNKALPGLVDQPSTYLVFTEKIDHEVAWSEALSSLRVRRRPFAGDRRPTLVTFLDAADPASLRHVPYDNPSAVLGSDVLAVRTWIDMTKDPVTWTLPQHLPWVDQPQSAHKAWLIVTRGMNGTSSSPVQIFREWGDR